MDTYPNIIFFCNEKYNSQICDVYHKRCYVTNDEDDLELLHNIADWQILITFGESDVEYYDAVYKHTGMTKKIETRWLHYRPDAQITEDDLIFASTFCMVQNAIGVRAKIRPDFSIFTTTFNSYDKIYRAYKSLCEQTFSDWEWVIVDDSPTDDHFKWLKTQQISHDSRVRIYARSNNSGNIGNVKNEAISLSRGKYLLELDHDDSIMPTLLEQAVKEFTSNPQCGFIYTDFVNIYDNGANFTYGDGICCGYGGYYMQRIDGEWRYVYVTPNINNCTLSYLPCCPNHPRIWRRTTMDELGGFCEMLPICDDYEILLRTCTLSTYTVTKIHTVGYIQYMNAAENGGNFSLIRNAEINRIGPKFIFPQFATMYDFYEVMKAKSASELFDGVEIWKKPPEWKPAYLNSVILPIGITARKMVVINDSADLCAVTTDDVTELWILSSVIPLQEMCDKLQLSHKNIRCYSIIGASECELHQYFARLLH